MLHHQKWSEYSIINFKHKVYGVHYTLKYISVLHVITKELLIFLAQLSNFLYYRTLLSKSEAFFNIHLNVIYGRIILLLITIIMIVRLKVHRYVAALSLQIIVILIIVYQKYNLWHKNGLNILIFIYSNVDALVTVPLWNDMIIHKWTMIFVGEKVHR